MLKGQASTFYYNYLAGKGYNFNRMIYELKYYFKTEEQAAVYIGVERDYFPKDYCYKPRCSLA
jgi:hypothetical protein